MASLPAQAFHCSNSYTNTEKSIELVLNGASISKVAEYIIGWC
jgi:hypothetical protein